MKQFSMHVPKCNTAWEWIKDCWARDSRYEQVSQEVAERFGYELQENLFDALYNALHVEYTNAVFHKEEDNTG